MKRNIIKLLSGFIIGFSLFGTCIVAHADVAPSHWISEANGTLSFF
ncbi:hypothetical protein [Clostridium saccharobutylicum]|nr:hypothetical protein [Clostridium saccharobutylicum]